MSSSHAQTLSSERKSIVSSWATYAARVFWGLGDEPFLGNCEWSNGLTAAGGVTLFGGDRLSWGLYESLCVHVERQSVSADGSLRRS